MYMYSYAMTVTGFQHIGSYLQQHCTAAATEDMACDDMKWLKLHILMCAEKLKKTSLFCCTEEPRK